ncbi:two-component sensor histidine kinase [Amycolatopsis sp. WAC 01376]|uniref:sensor histidine kinase n=1 Tax=Amycolatopsis sp. WAC 01376 TaxID=2203195 RepID=UPI000F783FB3|nr:histidine kinase [Amycolatopsis sp. WAC 01376]RSM59036.1 two-component sensor histidine kinase [Amycolatopsis sp. WAC 01376]
MITEAGPQPLLRPWGQAWRLLAASGLGVLLWLLTASQLPVGATGPRVDWLITGDPLIALACLIALLWRRRFPVVITTAVILASTVSVLAGGAALLALCSLAARRRPAETAVAAVLSVVTAVLTVGIYPQREPPGPLWLLIILPTLMVGIVVAVGAAIGARREEVRSLRERVESAEREQAARAAEARIVERHRIAREMHDVLAHRVSLVAMQAGVLGHRPDLPADQVAELARGIADGSHQALEELRDVLGVLRASPDELEPPQPSLADLPSLVADARALGLDVTLTVTTSGEPPGSIARTVYRIVQEGLTNAGKHAPGAEVRVTVEGEAGDGLRATVRDSGAARAIAGPPASGYGLLGLSERVGLAGGELDHHPEPGGGFVLTARLPWPAREGSE